MWALIQPWLLRNALGLLGWLAAAAAAAAVLLGARQAGRNLDEIEAEIVEARRAAGLPPLDPAALTAAAEAERARQEAAHVELLESIDARDTDTP